MTFDKIDGYFILVFGVWFLAKSVLFTVTWLVSRNLMKGKVRTRLSAAQHILFLGLAIVGAAMGPAFLLSYFSGTGVMVADPRIEPVWITNVIRIVLLTGLAIVTVAGARSFVAQYKRYHGIEDDPNDEVLEQTNVRQDVRESEQNSRQVQQDARTVTQNEIQASLDNGEVMPIAIDTTVADTIGHTATAVQHAAEDLEVVKGDVRHIKERMDNEGDTA